ncbi:MAG: glycoside hydrolase family 65 protein [Phycisphaerales bacterium JB039]
MTTWNLAYDDWNPDRQPVREALCTLGNGFFASRGAAEEARAGGAHYPGTYIACAYNRLATEVSGRTIENEDLVNWPNWLHIAFRPEDGQWMRLEDCETLEFSQNLDLRRGALERRITVRDADGRTSTIHTRRFISMARPHLAAIEWTLTPRDWSGPLVIRSEIDGSVTNSGVGRYQDLNGDHLRIEQTGRDGEQTVYLVARASQSMLRVALAARHRLTSPDADGPAASGKSFADQLRVGHEFTLPGREGEQIRLEKTCAVYTQRDHAISEPALEARKAVRSAGDFEELLHAHQQAWERLWESCDIELATDEFTQRTLRLHIFHLLQTTSMNTIDHDVGVPARGWHGEAYRGHIFWDELFIFPYLTLRIPELTRALLMYRFRRLDEARAAAAEEGYAGAMFPWQSGSNGREESQTLHLNPRSGRWIPDNTRRQRHINAAIAYNVWQYYQATGDEEFLSFYGAEMIFEIARFWAAIATFNDERGRYDINGVVGPDEYHTDDPDAPQPGLRNNAYTNIMAAWTLRCARRVMDSMPRDRCLRLQRDLGVTGEELSRWDEVARRLYIPLQDDGVISQFEGYEALEEFNWAGYRKKYGDIQRLDRILEAEDDTPNRYKASKQADVLMLFYLFSAEELASIFEQLGYQFDPEIIPRNIDYYSSRTSHGSTLSRVAFAWVLARSHREASWKCFEEALRSDVEDIQGGTTSEGIHLGAMAGTVDLVQRCYTGLELRDDTLWFNPELPDDLGEVRFQLRFRGHTLSLRIDHEQFEVSSCRGGPLPIRIGVGGEVAELRQGQTRTESLRTQPA